jgi:hypothetical protein
MNIKGVWDPQIHTSTLLLVPFGRSGVNGKIVLQIRWHSILHFLKFVNDANFFRMRVLNPLKAELNPIRPLLALLGAHRIFHVSRIRVNMTILSSRSLQNI